MKKKELLTLADAMVAWTGWKTTISPLRDDQIFAERFGTEQAAKWLSTLHALEDDFYSSDARHVAKDLQEMAAMSSEQFRKKNHDVDDCVVQALAWCYTFDYK